MSDLVCLGEDLTDGCGLPQYAASERPYDVDGRGGGPAGIDRSTSIIDVEPHPEGVKGNHPFVLEVRHGHRVPPAIPSGRPGRLVRPLAKADSRSNRAGSSGVVVSNQTGGGGPDRSPRPHISPGQSSGERTLPAIPKVATRDSRRPASDRRTRRVHQLASRTSDPSSAGATFPTYALASWEATGGRNRQTSLDA